MIPVTDPYDGILLNDPVGKAGNIVYRFGDDEIQFIFHDHVVGAGGFADENAELDVGVKIGKAADDGGHQLFADGSAGAYPDHVQRLFGAQHTVIQVQKAQRLVIDTLAEGGDVEAVGKTVKKLVAVVGLHLLNGHADGGLGDVQAVGRPGDGPALPADSSKNFNVTKGHSNILPVFLRT